MHNSKSLYITKAAIIAALYIVLTIIVNTLNLASGPIQIRISEALTILPFFTASAVPGLFVGCFLSNLITGCLPWDIVFGSIATLLGAIGTKHIAKLDIKAAKWLAPIPAIVSNTVVIPLILVHIYHLDNVYPYFMLTIGVSEFISAGVLGILLLITIKKSDRIYKLLSD